MVMKLPLQAAKAVPVTVGEFHAAFVRIWNDAAPRRNKNAVGLAISGGVDSMALASLCAKIQHRELIRGLSFCAFVVDHGARVNSGEEAEAVSKLLTEKGIATRILKIKWPQDLTIEQSSNFESLAREYRFKALGKACRDAKLDALFVAHHEDDQAETILMRLALGHKSPSGLMGMKSRSNIPECFGIHGVDESGHMEDLEETGGSIPTSSPQDQTRWGRVSGGLSLPMPFEDGGVMVYRPLLDFSKERLIATCLEHNTSWFEDHTNADPTLTFRNAIRRINKRHTLPAALQKGSLLELARRMTEKHNELISKAMSTLTRSSVRLFDPRAGRLILRFPKIQTGSPLPATEAEKEKVLQHHRAVASAVLKIATSAISPKENVGVHDMTTARKAVFRQLHLGGLAKDRETAFTTAGVKYDRLDEYDPPKDPHLQVHEWSLTRQHYSSVASERPLLVIPPAGDTSDSEEWSLYDGRYWMRIVNHTQGTLHVRPLQIEDIGVFEMKQRRKDPKLRTLLKTRAPGMVRFILPAIVAVSEFGQEEILAIPTLDIGVRGVEHLVEWEVRYKKVDGLGQWVKQYPIPKVTNKRHPAKKPPTRLKI